MGFGEEDRASRWRDQGRASWRRWHWGWALEEGRTEYVVMEGRSFWAKTKTGLTEDIIVCVWNSPWFSLVGR